MLLLQGLLLGRVQCLPWCNACPSATLAPVQYLYTVSHFYQVNVAFAHSIYGGCLAPSRDLIAKEEPQDRARARAAETHTRKAKPSYQRHLKALKSCPKNSPYITLDIAAAQHAHTVTRLEAPIPKNLNRNNIGAESISKEKVSGSSLCGWYEKDALYW